jgi:filamentous hemagglutinin family protein
MNRKAVLKLTPLAASVLLALGSTVVHAAPAAGVLPGAYSTNSANTSYTTAASNAAVLSVSSGATVIQYGGTALTTSVTAPTGITTVAGFNIGAGATLTVQASVAAGAGNHNSVLISDLTGAASEVDGTLSSTFAGGLAASDAPTLFVANANGVIVGSAAAVSAANGLALVGYTQTDAAVVNIAAPGAGAAYTATGEVTVSKGASLNAGYLLVAGAGNVNVDASALASATNVAIDAGYAATMTPSAAAAIAAGVTASTAALNLSGAFGTTTTTIAGAGAATIASGSTLNDNNLTFGGSLTNAGSVTTSITAIGGALTNTGTVSASALANVGGAFTNSGIVTAGSLSATGDVVNNGQLTVSAVTVTGALTNNGVTTVTANGATLLASNGITNAGKLTATGTGPLVLKTNATFSKATAIANSGTITAAGLTIDGASAFTNTGSLYAGANAVTIGTAGLGVGGVNLGGTIASSSSAKSVASLSVYSQTGDVTLTAPVNATGTVGVTAAKGSVYDNGAVTATGAITESAQNQLMVNAAVKSSSTVGLTTTKTWTGPYSLGVVVQSTGSISGTGVTVSADTASKASSLLAYGNITASAAAGFSFTGSSVYTGTGASIKTSTASFNYGGVITGGIASGTQSTDPYKNAVVVGDGVNAVTIDLVPTSLGTATQNTNVMGVGNTTLNVDTTNFGANLVILKNAAVVVNNAFKASNLFVRAQGGTLSLNEGPTGTYNNTSFYWPGLIYASTVKAGALATVDSSNAISFNAANTTNVVSNALPLVSTGGQGVYLMSASLPTTVDVTTNVNGNINVYSLTPTLSGTSTTFTGTTGSLSGSVLTYSTAMPTTALVAFTTPNE